ncbi:MAG: biotin/lipoyl-binding protein [Candidatus Schekmanbacteria bacterium]|nr:MAG: biotin/lipoyl-binding protein [Candidatus Schekmanbacteria bacterium]
MMFEILIGNDQHTVEVEKTDKGYKILIDNEESIIADAFFLKDDLLSIISNNKSYLVNLKNESRNYTVDLNGETFKLEVYEEGSTRRVKREKAGAQGKQTLKAPMPGKVVKLLVKEGDEVEAGDGLIIIEAMKMENELKASVKGVVKEINAEEGKTVNAGEPIIVIE